MAPHPGILVSFGLTAVAPVIHGDSSDTAGARALSMRGLRAGQPDERDLPAGPLLVARVPGGLGVDPFPHCRALAVGQVGQRNGATMVYIAREIDGCIAAMTIDSGVGGGCRRSSLVPEIASSYAGESTILVSFSFELHNRKASAVKRH